VVSKPNLTWIDCSVNECSAGICSHSDLCCKVYILCFVGDYVIIFSSLCAVDGFISKLEKIGYVIVLLCLVMSPSSFSDI
jgi:hypothetical protein